MRNSGCRLSDSANKITAGILLRVSEEMPHVILWRNNRISAMAMGAGGKLRRVDAGIDGQGDICGIAGPSGLGIQIEVKAGRDKMRESQKRFKAMWIAHGGLYLEARSSDQCVADLRERLGEYA